MSRISSKGPSNVGPTGEPQGSAEISKPLKSGIKKTKQVAPSRIDAANKAHKANSFKAAKGQTTESTQKTTLVYKKKAAGKPQDSAKISKALESGVEKTKQVTPSRIAAANRTHKTKPLPGRAAPDGSTKSAKKTTIFYQKMRHDFPA